MHTSVHAVVTQSAEDTAPTAAGRAPATASVSSQGIQPLPCLQWSRVGHKTIVSR